MTKNKKRQNLLCYQKRVKKTIRIKMLKMIMMTKRKKMLTMAMKMTQKMNNTGQMRKTMMVMRKIPLTR